MNRTGDKGDDPRLMAARAWLRQRTGEEGNGWTPVTGDASYRRYFRVWLGGRSLMLMDAPPDREPSDTFVDVAGRLRDAGLHAPEILEHDLDAGFLLLEDLGDGLYRDLLDEASVDGLFDEAFRALSVMATRVSPGGLPAYDPDLFGKELDWFTHYYLEVHRGWAPTASFLDPWRRLCQRLVDNAAEQPQVFVHKDIHSCNLLRTTHNSPGIIDFQDAVRGPVTYDFVSLVWDRYHGWARDRIESWMEDFRRRTAPQSAPETWRRWCDLSGLQRNLKIVGRFALLRHAQGKHGYVELIPRFYGFVLDTLNRYPEFRDLAEQLEQPRCAP